MQKIRSELQLFVNAQEDKLRRNDHKPHWKNSSIRFLIKRLKDEIEELEIEIEKGSELLITHEAVDVANFAMMIFDNAKNGRIPKVIKVTSDQYVKLAYDCTCGFRIREVKHRTLYELELKQGKIKKNKVCEQCKNKIMKLGTKIFTK